MSVTKLRYVHLCLIVFITVSCLLLSRQVHATPYLPYESTWYDVNKANPRSDDNNLCWAAAASNILMWGGWDTPSYSTTQLIFNEYKAHWNDKGSLSVVAWEWWLNGDYIQGYPPNTSWATVDVSGGGNLWPQTNLGNYYLETWDPTSSMAAINYLLHNGYGVTLAIYKDYNGQSNAYGHAITCWGYEYDDTNPNYYTNLYITDSDDYVTQLQTDAVAWNATDGRWEITDGILSGWHIDGVTALDSNIVYSTMQDDWSMYTDLGINFDPAEIGQLTQLYYDGKANENPASLTIDNYEWSYFSDQMAGKQAGDTWRDGEDIYFYFGSGVKGTPLGGGADVPEPSTLLLLLPFIGFGLRRVRLKKG